MIEKMRDEQKCKVISKVELGGMRWDEKVKVEQKCNLLYSKLVLVGIGWDERLKKVLSVYSVVFESIHKWYFLDRNLVTSPRQDYSVLDQTILESTVQSENRNNYQHGDLLVRNVDNRND